MQANYSAEVEPIIGRYIHLRLGERDNRVYYEESVLSDRTGIPLVCLHTAGSDSTQFRHLMADADVANNFRVIAFDLPWHGKSLPPIGYQEEEYRLTTESYVEAITAFCHGLALERPVVMGCSMGGRIVLELALHHSEELRAVIALEASDYQEPWYDTEWLHRPDVHGGEVCAALISGLIAPQSPDECRWETLWGYLSSGAGVFKGDLHFYRQDSDYRAHSSQIDTKLCPMFLLTGEYDFSCTPEDTKRTGRAIAGSEVTIMKGLGHFPMSENPAHFRNYLLPVLQKILSIS